MLEQLKARPSTQNIPVIVCTAAPMTADYIEPYLKTHDVDLLHKPFTIDDLLHLVTQGLEAEHVSGKVLIAQVLPDTLPSRIDAEANT
jgi:CheY-like chemotaxis protein